MEEPLFKRPELEDKEQIEYYFSKAPGEAASVRL